jgi:deazaflavin-dependent oxidoreductase (nitroreductase family)
VVKDAALTRTDLLMRDEVREALDIDRSTPIADRTIDITTTGRRSGQPRRTEICFYRFGDSIYLSGMPRPRPRDWLANLVADPHFTFHLKQDVIADLPAVAEVITNRAERRGPLTQFAEDVNLRNGPGSAVPDDWVEHSPLAKVTFLDA